MSRNETLWQTFPQFFGLKTKTGFKIRKNVRKKAYNKHIIIIVTWSGVQYHVSWMRPYHWITLDATLRVSGDSMVWPHPLDVIQYARSSYYYDNMYVASRVIQWYGLIHETWYCTPDQVTIMIICIYHWLKLVYFVHKNDSCRHRAVDTYYVSNFTSVMALHRH